MLLPLLPSTAVVAVAVTEHGSVSGVCALLPLLRLLLSFGDCLDALQCDDCHCCCAFVTDLLRIDYFNRYLLRLVLSIVVVVAVASAALISDPGTTDASATTPLSLPLLLPMLLTSWR